MTKSSNKIECVACGEVYNAGKNKTKKCPNCNASNKLSSDLEIPMDFAADYIASLSPTIEDLEKTEIRENIGSYMNYKTRAKAKRAELEWLETNNKIEQIKNNGNGRHECEECTREPSHSPGTGAISNPFLFNSILGMEEEERNRWLDDLSSHPEKAFVLSMLLNPGSQPQHIPFFGFPGAFMSQGSSNGGGNISDIMASFANSMNGVFSSILEVLSKREENAIKPTEYITSMSNLIQAFNTSQSTNEVYMNSMLEMFKIMIENSQPAIVEQRSEDQTTVLMFDLLKSLLEKERDRGSGLSDADSKLKMLEEQIKRQNEEKKQQEYNNHIKALEKELIELKKQLKERERAESQIQNKQKTALDSIKELKEQVDLLADLGIVRRNDEPIVIKENGEAVQVKQQNTNKIGVDDKIKLEEWELDKKKKLLELDLMKMREENRLKKEMEKEEKEKETEKERRKTINALIDGGANIFSSLLASGNDKEKERKQEKNNGLKKVPISDSVSAIGKTNNQKQKTTPTAFL